jgi:transcriptional regulator with PAS, ATPase and Fis domain
MLEIFETIKKIAVADVDVLIYGESGTGKELVARSVHARSRRADQPFVPVDCASIPENLLESELFGHDRGAFTGALTAKPGIFEFANHGTLFLDEVGRLSINLQAKLLRALQERQIRRVGGRELIPIDVRVISATNVDLREAITKEEFREDLYYRLNVVVISLPPLRDRAEDIPLLVNHYLQLFNQSTSRNVQGVRDDAMMLLIGYSWPGNVRELMNVVERAVLLVEGDVLTPRDFSADLCCEQQGTFRPDLPYKEAKQIWVEAFENRYMNALLKRFNDNISRAAQEAGIAPKTIHRFLNKHRD